MRFRLVDVDLAFDCDDESFVARADEILGDLVAAGPPSDVLLSCRIRGHGEQRASLAFDGPGPLDLVAFAAALFEDRGYHEGPATSAGRRALRDADGTVVMVGDGHDAADIDTPVWRSIAASLAINRALSLQPEVLFLHAGSISVGGRGVVLSGPKGAGKSTLSMALAARGHGFLGDEIAAVRRGSWSLAPFRRATSVRQGPSASRVREAIDTGAYPWETLPDGTQRRRVRVGRLFSGTTGSGGAPPGALVFLEGFARRPKLLRLRAHSDLTGRFQVLPVSFWGGSKGRCLMDLLRLVFAVPCFSLEAADPDETAALIEAALETL